MARSTKVLVVLILCCSLLCGCSMLPDALDPIVLTVDDLTITMPGYYENYVTELIETETELLIRLTLSCVHKDQTGRRAALGDWKRVVILAQRLPIFSGVYCEAAATAVNAQGNVKVLTQLCPQLRRHKQPVLIVHLCRVFTDHKRSPLLHFAPLCYPFAPFTDSITDTFSKINIFLPDFLKKYKKNTRFPNI